MPPWNGDLGDCPQTLSSGSSCLPSCRTGYELAPEGGVARCRLGQLSLPTCHPSACNVSEAAGRIEHLATLGDCPEVMASGGFCEPECMERYEPSGNLSCHFGNLTDVDCLLVDRCPAGEERLDAEMVETPSGGSCVPCPLGTYKSDEGPGPCQACPTNSYTNATGRTSSQHCSCPAFYYEQRNALDELLFCELCPNHSSVVGSATDGRQDCQCDEGYVEVEEHGVERCRPADPCNVSDLLENLTGPEDYKLKVGSCDTYAETSMLPSGKQCSLLCAAGLGAQLGSDIFRAIDLTIACQDGVLERRPPEGYVWCSEASWEVPPLVFLGLTTMATILGAAALEVRQNHFERQYAKALRGW